MYFKRRQKIYVAYLPYGKRYIGHTRNFKRRLNQHFLRKGSKVTQKYRPKYIKPIKDCYGEGKCKYQEQILVNKMIDKYGYDKVRGGRYTNSENF